MSDTFHRYRAIKRAIMQFYQPRPTGHREKHLNTLCALICGLTGGKHAHLPQNAAIRATPSMIVVSLRLAELLIQWLRQSAAAACR